MEEVLENNQFIIRQWERYRKVGRSNGKKYK